MENGVSTLYQTVLLSFILSQKTSSCLYLRSLVSVLDLTMPYLVLVTWTLSPLTHLWTVYSWYGLWFFSVIVCTRTVILFVFTHFPSSQKCKENFLIINQQEEDADRLNRSFIWTTCEPFVHLWLHISSWWKSMTLHHLLGVQSLARNLEPFDHQDETWNQKTEHQVYKKEMKLKSHDDVQN